MRKFTHLFKKVLAIFLAVNYVLFIILIVLSNIFIVKGEFLEHIVYKSKNLIVQLLEKGEEAQEEKTLVVLGNGWNVSIDENDRVVKHDPFFVIPKEEVKLLHKKGYEIITAYFPFECLGLNQSGWELAQFINQKYNGYKVILLGHSKSGVCFANLSKWLKADGQDVTIITVSAPYGGIKSDKQNKEKLNTIQQWIYSKIIIPHQTNEDITKGSLFLLEIADFSGLSTRNFYCIKSLIPDETSLLFDPITYALKWVDKKFQINGDGMVGFEEQQPPFVPKKEFVIRASHQNSMQRAIKKLLKEHIL